MAEIEWSLKAENDLNEIIDYIAQDSLEYALLFYDEVREKIENLIIVKLFLYLHDVQIS